MAYVPGHEIDIFISYAHFDDIKDVGEQRKWVEGFTEDLRIRLELKLKGKSSFDLWSDQKLAKHKDLRTELASKLEKSAVLVVILSPKYLDSEWCDFERKIFLDHLAHRNRSEAISTIFLIQTDKIDQDKLPSQFTNASYNFWVEYKQKDIVRRLHPHGNEEEKQSYIDEFDRMTKDLIKQLDELRSERETKAESGSIEIADAPLPSTIFLGKVVGSGNLFELRENLLSRFADEHIKSIPETFDNYPMGPNAFEEKMKQDLEQCQSFIQLLDESIGDRGKDLPDGWPGLQYKIAQEMNIDIVQWYDAQNRDLHDLKDDQHKNFLLNCQHNETLQIMSINDFEDMVIQKLNRPPSIPLPTARKIYVMIERKDSEAIGEPLKEAIWERQDLNAEFLDPCDDPLELERTKKREVRNSNGVIIVYGDINPSWVKSQITVCEKERTRNPLYNRLAICIAPPPPPPEPSDKLRQVNKKLAQMKVINWQGGFNKNELNKYLDSI